VLKGGFPLDKEITYTLEKPIAKKEEKI